jgi:hypothetical protein
LVLKSLALLFPVPSEKRMIDLPWTELVMTWFSRWREGRQRIRSGVSASRYGRVSQLAGRS